MQKIRWEKSDLVQTILSFRSALLNIISINSKQFDYTIKNLDRYTSENLAAMITSFFINNSPCSVLVMAQALDGLDQSGNPALTNLLKAFWVNSYESKNDLILTYSEIPESLLEEAILKSGLLSVQEGGDIA